MMRKQALEVLRSENADLGQEQLTLHERRFGVVQHCPDRHEILQLSSGLFHHTVLSLKHDRHAGQICHFGTAHNQTVDVETSRGENTGHAGEDTRLILDQTIEDVSFGRGRGWERSLIENTRDSCCRCDGG